MPAAWLGLDGAGKFPGGRLGVNRVDQRHFAPGHQPAGGTGVVAVVAAAGQNHDGVAAPGEIQRPLREDTPDILNDSRRGAARFPGRVFPLAHLGN